MPVEKDPISAIGTAISSFNRSRKCKGILLGPEALFFSKLQIMLLISSWLAGQMKKVLGTSLKKKPWSFSKLLSQPDLVVVVKVTACSNFEAPEKVGK